MSESDRISRLSFKLNKMTVPQESDSKNRLENCDLRYRHLETRFAEHQETQLQRYNTMKEQISKIQRQIDKEADESNDQADEVFRKLKSVQMEYTNIMNDEATKKKDGDFDLNKKIEEKTSNLRLDLATYHKQKENEMKELYEFIEVT